MARKPVYVTLPDLTTVNPGFRGFDPAVNKSAALLPKLRETIRKVQTDRPRAFYRMREASAFFGVSLRSTHQAYQQLEAEGLLIIERGAQTLVASRTLQPRHLVRGVVGVPIHLPVLFYGPDMRSLCIRLETELRRHHFVADFVFYGVEDVENSEDLTERLLEHDLDLVLWLVPPKEVTPVLKRLEDGGINVAVVSDGKSDWPRPQYLINRERGLNECFAAWQRAGIRSVAVLSQPGRKDLFDVAQRTARQRGLACVPQELSDVAAIAALRRLMRQRSTAVVLTPHHWYRSLCDQYPRQMARVFQACRVLLPQGAPFCPYFRGQRIPVDVIAWDHDRIARRLARDIGAGRNATPLVRASFATHWTPRLNLGELVEKI